jgi:hypothetical protein
MLAPTTRNVASPESELHVGLSSEEREALEPAVRTIQTARARGTNDDVVGSSFVGLQIVTAERPTVHTPAPPLNPGALRVHPACLQSGSVARGNHACATRREQFTGRRVNRSPGACWETGRDQRREGEAWLALPDGAQRVLLDRCARLDARRVAGGWGVRRVDVTPAVSGGVGDVVLARRERGSCVISR